MGWSDASRQASEAINSLSPQAQRDKQWAETAKGMEVAKFAASMQKNKLDAEKAAKEEERAAQKHALEIASSQRDADAAKEKYAFLDEHKQYNQMVSDTETFIQKSASMNDDEKHAAIMDIADKYKNRPEMQEALTKGTTAPLMKRLTELEQYGMQRNYIEDGPERETVVDISGNLNTLSKGSSMFDRPVSESEKYVLSKYPQAKWGTPEFKEGVQLHEDGMFDKITVRMPDGMPREMTKQQAAAQGLMTEAQYKHAEKEAAASQAEKDATKARREQLRSMIGEASGIRTELQTAAETAKSAMQLLRTEVEAGGGKDATPWGVGNSLSTTFGRSGFDLTGEAFWNEYSPKFGMNEERSTLEGYMTQLQGFAGLKKMLDLKAASPTGSTGFGALNEKELDILTSVLGSQKITLNQDETLHDRISSVNDVIQKMLGGYMAGDVETTNDKENPQQMIFLGGDPNDINNWEVY